MKQDRNGVRTAQDLERKYNLADLVGIKKAVQQSVEGINKTNAELENFMTSTLETIEELENRIDGSITTYYSSGVPTLSNYPANEWNPTEYSIHVGNMYYDKDTGYAYRFLYDEGEYKWIKIADSDVEEALAIANAAKDTADGKRRVFTGTPFTPYDEGDLWLNNKDLYVCSTPKTSTQSYSASDFTIATKYTDDTSLNNFVNVTYTKQVDEFNSLINTKITTWYYSGTPTLSNAPANEWKTNELKSSHVGDLYYDKVTGYTYRFNYENSVYAWEHIIDKDLTEALALANASKDTADSKRRIFTTQPTPPYDNGDLWFNNQEIYICQISKAEGSFATNDFIIATKYTDDTLATQIGDNLEVVRGQVLTVTEGVDAFKIDIESQVKTINDLQEETIEAVERMSYTFGTNDFTIANSNEPFNARMNNQGLKVYTYNTLNSIFNHKGSGFNKLIVTGDSQLANVSIVKAIDENGDACTDINHLVSNIQDLTDLEN